MRRGNLIATTLAALLAALMAVPRVGDTALIQGFQMTGHLGVQVIGDGLNGAVGAASSISGSFQVAPFPPGGLLVASVYGNDWGQTTQPPPNVPIDLVFNLNAVPPGPVFPLQNDAVTGGFTLSVYRWNVAPFVVSPGAYSYTIGQGALGQQLYGAVLVLVYLDPAAPLTTVTLIEGARQVGESGPETESIAFTGLPAGPTALWIFTGSDDGTATGEVVSYNGAAVGGPLDGNLGLGASLVQANVTSLAGTNTASISPGAELFGWVLAVTAAPAPPSSVPAPRPLALVAAGLLLGAAFLLRARAG